MARLPVGEHPAWPGLAGNGRAAHFRTRTLLDRAFSPEVQRSTLASQFYRPLSLGRRRSRYRRTAFRRRAAGAGGLSRASTNASRSRVLKIMASCSRSVRDAVSCAEPTTKSVRDRPVNSAALMNRAFCCLVMRASNRAVFSDERPMALCVGIMPVAPPISVSVRLIAVHVKLIRPSVVVCCRSEDSETRHVREGS